MNGYALVKDGELYYEVDGEGHPLVLIHAGVADHSMWDEFIPALSRRFRVIRYDLRGYGKSRTANTAYSNRQDLIGLLDHLGSGQAHVVGISIGGQIAIDFTVEHPERVSALVPVASGLGGMDWPEGFSDPISMAAEEAIEAAEAAGDWEQAAEMSGALWADGPGQPLGRAASDIRERVRRWTLNTYTRQDGKAQPIPLDPPAIARLGEIHIPTLVVVGDLDEKIVLIMADEIVGGIPGARKVVFENAAHMIPLEYPERFTELLLSFLP